MIIVLYNYDGDFNITYPQKRFVHVRLYDKITRRIHVAMSNGKPNINFMEKTSYTMYLKQISNIESSFTYGSCSMFRPIQLYKTYYFGFGDLRSPISLENLQCTDMKAIWTNVPQSTDTTTTVRRMKTSEYLVESVVHLEIIPT